MRFAFYVSGDSKRVEKYLNQIIKEKIDQNLILLISDKKLSGAYIDLIETHGIVVKELLYTNLFGSNNREKNLQLSNFMLEEFKNYKIDYCFSFGNHLLSGDLLKVYENKIVNFHPAILPMYPGINAIDQAVDNGKTFLVGNTAHFIDAGMDTGPIIMQSVIPLYEFYATRDYNVVLDLQINMMNKIVELLNQNRIIVEDGRVTIVGADYGFNAIFPQV